LKVKTVEEPEKIKERFLILQKFKDPKINIINTPKKFK